MRVGLAGVILLANVSAILLSLVAFAKTEEPVHRVPLRAELRARLWSRSVPLIDVQSLNDVEGARQGPFNRDGPIDSKTDGSPRSPGVRRSSMPV